MFTNIMAITLHVQAINTISACSKHVVQREGEGGGAGGHKVHIVPPSRKYQRDIQLAAFKVSDRGF